MNLSDSEVIALNTFLNGSADLPVDIEALNVKFREHLGEDNTVIAPEVEAAVAEEVAAEAAPEAVPTEVVDAPVEAAPTDVAPAPEVAS